MHTILEASNESVVFVGATEATAYLSQREIISALDYCSHEHLLQSDYAIISLQGQNA